MPHTNNQNNQNNHPKTIGRRTLLKALTATGGAIATTTILPDKWLKPVVEVGMLPAHAQASPTLTATPTTTPTITPTATPINIPGPTRFLGSITGTDTTLTWDYDSAFNNYILGFRIYGGQTLPYQLLADENTLTNQTRQWITPTEQTCVRYYIVAVYLDPSTNQIVESNSSNLWAGNLC